MESEVSEKMDERVVKGFLDVLILTRLRHGHHMGGYDVIRLIHNKFGLLISAGTIYSVIQSLEIDGMIKGNSIKRKKVYIITDKGKERVKAMLNEYPQILNVMEEIFS